MGHIATRIDSPTTHRLIGLATLLGAALMLCLGALSSPTSAAAATPSVLTFPLCTAQGDQWDPAVSGNNVVWYDSRNGATTLYAYDLSTKTESLIASASCPDYFKGGGGSSVSVYPGPPAISGDTVVWVDGIRSLDPGVGVHSWDIWGYDLVRRARFPICTEYGDQQFPAISGNTVVWSYGGIWGYDLSTRTEFPISTGILQGSPAISGNTVVWEDYRNGDWDIYGYDLSTRTEFPVCTDPGPQMQPGISGNIVVWTDDRDSHSGVSGYDLSTKSTIDIAEWGNLPAISGNIVVWHDMRVAGHRDNIYGYDLSTHTDFAICTTSPGSSTLPAVSDGTVAWTDSRSSGTDIYAATLAPPGTLICTSSYDFAADATSHWHDDDQTVAISASGGSALTIHYSADGGDSWTSIAGRNATIKVSASGAHHFLYYASDASGSGATCDAGYVNIDKTAPLTEVSGVSYGWVNRPVTVMLSALDPLSGVASTQYRLRGAATWTTYTAPFTVSAHGASVYECRSTDNVGNVGAAKTFTVRIAAKSKISRLSPASGSRGATVTIVGMGFGVVRGSSSVKFGTAKCTTYVSWGGTQIKCKVPVKAKYGALKVTVTTKGVKSNALSFKVKR